MLELMGGKKIELDPGFLADRLQPNTILPGRNAGDIGSLVAMVTALSTTLESITGKTDTLFASLNNVLQGDTLKESLSQTLAEARMALSHIDFASQQASSFLSKNGPELSRTLIAADSAMASVNGAIGENRNGFRALIDSGGRAMFETRRSLARLDSLLANASEQKTLLYRLTRDKEFSGRMDSVINSLFRLSEQIRLQGIDANVRFFNSSKPEK
jgi:phospholipid/cholesterol/gamma-HCH transport system substrate-binding protein